MLRLCLRLVVLVLVLVLVHLLPCVLEVCCGTNVRGRIDIRGTASCASS